MPFRYFQASLKYFQLKGLVFMFILGLVKKIRKKKSNKNLA